MLVPLQGTLPGWPTTPQPSAMHLLGLLIGIPLVIFLILSLITKGPDLIRAGRGEEETPAGAPLWLGAAPADRAVVTTGAEAARAEAVVTDSVAMVGGASVRW